MRFESYADQGRTTVMRTLLALALCVVLTLGLSIGLATVLQLMGAPLAQWTPQLTTPGADPRVFFIGAGVIFAILSLSLGLAVALAHRRNPLGLLGDWKSADFVRGLLYWLALLCAFALAEWLIAPGTFRVAFDGRTAGLFAAAAPALLIQTASEEFIFRGYLTQVLLKGLKRPWAAAVLSGVIFGSAHIPNGLPQAANAVVFGVILSMIAIRSGGLAFGCGLHFMNNLFGAVLVVSESDVFHGAPGFVAQSAPSWSPWIDVSLSSLLLIATFYLGWGRVKPAPDIMVN